MEIKFHIRFWIKQKKIDVFKMFSFVVLYAFHPNAMSQTDITNFGDIPREKKGIRIMFYNVENLFDTHNDSLTLDDEFTPIGEKYWSWKKYQDKLQKIGQVINAVGKWEYPALVGLCEIENEGVLKDLVYHPLCKKAKYKILHKDSPDRRGIDVGLLYRPDKFNIYGLEFITVKFPFDTLTTTRDILYAKGVVLEKDTLHVFVNHWSSRRGGMMYSQPKREYQALLLKEKVDSIMRNDKNANIIITGDFNDEPENKSLKDVLQAQDPKDNLKEGCLFNLMYEKIWQEGSHKFDGKWGILDQFIVSEALITGKNSLKTTSKGAQIFKKHWLLQKESRDLGDKPFRTYQGMKYLGGFSDHLPIYLDIVIIKEKF